MRPKHERYGSVQTNQIVRGASPRDESITSRAAHRPQAEDIKPNREVRLQRCKYTSSVSIPLENYNYRIARLKKKNARTGSMSKSTLRLPTYPGRSAFSPPPWLAPQGTRYQTEKRSIQRRKRGEKKRTIRREIEAKTDESRIK